MSSSLTITTKSAGRYMKEYLAGKTVKGRELTRAELQNLQVALTAHANGMARESDKSTALAKINARASELGLGELVEQAREVSTACVHQGNKLNRLVALQQEVNSLVQEIQAGHEAQREKADDVTFKAMLLGKQQGELGKLTASTVESSITVQKRCVDELTNDIDEERKRHRSEKEADEQEKAQLQEALTQRIALTEQCEKVMAEQDARLKGDGLVESMEETLEGEMVNLRNKVDEQKAALAEQVAQNEALQDELQTKKDVILTYFDSDQKAAEDKGLKKAAEEEFMTCHSQNTAARSSNEKAPQLPLPLTPTEDCRTTLRVPSTASPPPSTKTPFSANVDWGDSPVRSDTLSLNSSEKYRWFNNDDLESCTDNGDDEGNGEDEGCAISDPY